MAETEKKRPEHCEIALVIRHRTAVAIVKRFREGESTRSLSRCYQLSRAGVESTIRSFGWRRNGQRAAAR